MLKSRSSRVFWITVVAVLVLVIGLPVALSFFAKRPDDLGVTDGHFRPCPDSPNCVNSQSKSPQHAIPAIAFEGTTADASQQIRRALQSMPRTTIVRDEGDYLHAECRSAFFRFVDDVEIFIDTDERVIHVRSASRVGWSDLGVNRKRVEAIRQEFEKQNSGG